MIQIAMEDPRIQAISAAIQDVARRPGMFGLANLAQFLAYVEGWRRGRADGGDSFNFLPVFREWCVMRFSMPPNWAWDAILSARLEGCPEPIRAAADIMQEYFSELEFQGVDGILQRWAAAAMLTITSIDRLTDGEYQVNGRIDGLPFSSVICARSLEAAIRIFEFKDENDERLSSRTPEVYMFQRDFWKFHDGNGRAFPWNY